MCPPTSTVLTMSRPSELVASCQHPVATAKVQYRNLRLLITSRPSSAVLHQYGQSLRQNNVTDVVRVCEANYDKRALEALGIRVYDLPFEDGQGPTPDVIEQWIELLKKRFFHDEKSHKDKKKTPPSSTTEPVANGQPAADGNAGSPSWAASATGPTSDNCFVAVHCVAGLGRAPVLVCLALMETGMSYDDAVHFVRMKRDGALNESQLKFLRAYRPNRRLRKKQRNWLSSCFRA